MRIAALDDEPEQLAYLAQTLIQQVVVEGDTTCCVTFSTGESLRRALRRETFDLLVLDWNVPDLDGVDLLRWLRTIGHNPVPVIMLTSRSSELDMSEALGLGADDYVVKPFRPLELGARVKRLMARQQALDPTSRIETFGGWTFDRARLTACFTPSLPATDANPDAAQQFTLTDREFRLTLAFFRNMGKTISRAYLLENAGYSGEEMSSRVLDSHIYRLRTKLGLHSTREVRLQTIYGQGYRLDSTHHFSDTPAGSAASGEPGSLHGKEKT